MNIIMGFTEGYPDNYSANNTKASFMSKGFNYLNHKTTILDNFIGSKNTRIMVNSQSVEGINYYKLPRLNRITDIFRNIYLFNKILRKEYCNNESNILILGLPYYPVFPVLCLLARIQGYKVFALFHEWDLEQNFKNKFLKLEAYIRMNTFGYFLNGVLPISEFLVDKSKKFSKPILKLPILADFTDKTIIYNNNNFFTYCGHAEYLIRNQELLKGFSKIINVNKDFFLNLILIGKTDHFKILESLWEKFKIKDNIIVYNQISQEELFNIYSNSLGLIIPLNPKSIRDIARFSQKIAEYLSTKRPIITNNVGEINYYFENNVNAIIVDYSSEGFYFGMKYLIDNRNVSSVIGENGFILGSEKFNVVENCKKLDFFFDNS